MTDRDKSKPKPAGSTKAPVEPKTTITKKVPVGPGGGARIGTKSFLPGDSDFPTDSSPPRKRGSNDDAL